MKTISMLNFLNLKELLKSYQQSIDSLVNIQIGYDDRVYILLSAKIPERIQGMFVDTEANTSYAAICLSVDWDSGEVVYQEIVDLKFHKMNFHFIQPIGENILLLGARCMYHKNNGPEKNAVIVDSSGKVIDEFCLGDGIQDCMVTDDGDIITSYFDEGVFGNFGWDQPIGSCGLIVWSGKGEIKWEAKRPIYDCYAMNIDEHNCIWYYYYDDFKLVKTDFNHDIVYNPQNSGFSGFLISKDGRTIIHDGGYHKHSDFFAETIIDGKLAQCEGVNFVYNGEALLNKAFFFRSSRAVLLDSKNRLFFIDIVKIG